MFPAEHRDAGTHGPGEEDQRIEEVHLEVHNLKPHLRFVLLTTRSCHDLTNGNRFLMYRRVSISRSARRPAQDPQEPQEARDAREPPQQLSSYVWASDSWRELRSRIFQTGSRQTGTTRPSNCITIVTAKIWDLWHFYTNKPFALTPSGSR